MMKKTTYLMLTLLGLQSISTTEKTPKIRLSTISIVLILTQHLAHKNYYKNQVTDHILNNYIRKAPINFFPTDLKKLITNFTHEWLIYGIHEKTQTIYNLDIYNTPPWEIERLYINNKQSDIDGIEHTKNYLSMALLIACENTIPIIDIAPLLFGNFQLNINIKDKYGYTPLIWCCQNGEPSLNIAKWLLQHKGIKVNLPDSLLTYTPLTWCCRSGETSLSIAQRLLQHKDTKVNLQSSLGNTPLDSMLFWARQKDKKYTYIKLWKTLVNHGALLNKCIKIYEQLDPNNFIEPQKSYIQTIKKHPPINLITSTTSHDKQQSTS